MIAHISKLIPLETVKNDFKERGTINHLVGLKMGKSAAKALTVIASAMLSPGRFHPIPKSENNKLAHDIVGLIKTLGFDHFIFNKDAKGIYINFDIARNLNTIDFDEYIPKESLNEKVRESQSTIKAWVKD